jgi:hypothetical protein
MAEAFRWEQSGQSVKCVSDARSWDELRPALIASWTRFADLLGSSIPQDVRHEIHLSFFSSSGRVNLGHASRSFPGVEWNKVPTDYIWSTMCKCIWIEEQWEAADKEEELAKVGVTFARTCLECATHQRVKVAFEKHELANVRVYGQGVTQSPGPFEVDLTALLDGSIPPLHA